MEGKAAVCLQSFFPTQSNPRRSDSFLSKGRFILAWPSSSALISPLPFVSGADKHGQKHHPEVQRKEGAEGAFEEKKEKQPQQQRTLASRAPQNHNTGRHLQVRNSQHGYGRSGGELRYGLTPFCGLLQVVCGCEERGTVPQEVYPEVPQQGEQRVQRHQREQRRRL